MENINIGDLSGNADVQVDDASLLSKLSVKSLAAKTNGLIADFSKPLGAAKFDCASFEIKYATPAIDLDSATTLRIEAEVNPSLKLYRAADSPLLGNDDFTPKIEIDSGQFWLGFRLGAEIGVKAGAAAPTGFGVSIEAKKQGAFAVYELFDQAAILRDAVAATFSRFIALRNSADIRAQEPGTVLTCDTGGTVTVKGSWKLPAGVSSYALAETRAPVKIEVEAGPAVEITGAIAVSGEFVFRSWKQNPDTAMIGLYKKQGTTLTATFTASTGLEADLGSTDLIGKFFSLIGPGADTSVLGADRDAARDALKDSVDRSLSMGLNATCSAAFSDESAFVYSVDLSRNPADTDTALNEAIAGDWTKIATLANATERKNAIGRIIETKQKIAVNLLGIYNYDSVADFIGNSIVVHCPEDGSVTITDKETAKRLTIASMPWRTNADQLRKVLSEAAISTAAWSFAKKGNTAGLTASQTLMTYKDSMDAASLAKALKAAAVLEVIADDQIDAAIGGKPHRHALIRIEQKIDDAAAREMFLDPATGEPWQEPALRAIGIGQLRNFLDPNQPDDLRRLEFLAHWPENQPPAPYSVDWLDITWWAESVAAASAKYVAAKAAFEKIPPGADASKDANFMNARKALARALEDMSAQEHSGFTPGWPLAVMYRLAREQSVCSMSASWDGQIQLQAPAVRAVAADVARPA